MAHRHRLIAAAFALFLLLVAACSTAEAPSPNGEDAPPQTAVTPSPHPLVSNAAEALGASVEAFTTQAESFVADFTMELSFADFRMGGTGKMSVIEPDQMHMVMEFAMPTGLPIDLEFEMEMLLVGDQMYMKMFTDDWYSMSLSDFGFDEEALKELEETFGGLDYVEFIEAIGGDVEYLGLTTVDGRELAHYRGYADVLDMLDAIAGFMGEDPDDFLSELEIPLQDFDMPFTIDVWLDPFDLLPYQMDMVMEFSIEGETMVMAFAFQLDYDQAVIIPTPPPDARPLDDMFLDFFGDDLDFDWDMDFDDFDWDDFGDYY